MFVLGRRCVQDLPMPPSGTPGIQFGMCECEVPLKQANISCSCLGPELRGKVQERSTLRYMVFRLWVSGAAYRGRLDSLPWSLEELIGV